MGRLSILLKLALNYYFWSNLNFRFIYCITHAFIQQPRPHFSLKVANRLWTEFYNPRNMNSFASFAVPSQWLTMSCTRCPRTMCTSLNSETKLSCRNHHLPRWALRSICTSGSIATITFVLWRRVFIINTPHMCYHLYSLH